MSILSVALAAWGTFALIRLVLVPRADALADAKRNTNGVRAAAVSSLSGFLSLASLTIALSTTAALGVLIYVNTAASVTLQQARAALDRVEQIHAFVGRFDTAIGITTTVVLIAALSYHVYRRGGRRLTEELKRHIAQEVSRLQEGALETLPPTAEMEQVAVMIRTIEGRVADLNDEGPARIQLVAKLNELTQQYYTMDLLRRIDTRLNKPPDVARSGLSRILLLLSSAGMLRSLKGASRMATVAGLLLLLPASMTIGLPEIRDAAESRARALTEQVLELDRSRVDRQFELLFGDVESETLSNEDHQAIDEIASIFESEVVDARYLQGVRVPQATATASRAVRAHASNLILEASGSHPAARAQLVRASSLEPLEQRLLDLNVGAAGPRRPVTTYGERLRADLRRVVPQLDPTVWAHVRRNVAEYVRSFQQAPDPRYLKAMTLSDALGHLVGGINLEGPLEKLLQQGAAQLTGDVAEAVYRKESRRFIAALAQSQGMEQAFDRLYQAPRPTSSTTINAVRSSVDEVITPANAPARRASLAVNPRPNIEAAQRAVQEIAQPTARASAADALISFGDLFPGQLTEPLGTAHARAVSSLSPAISRVGLQASYARARNYTRLRGFSKIGGVVLGRSPQTTTSLQAATLEWQLTDDEVALPLVHTDGSLRELGRFNPAVVHSALAYAADGRLTTVTMVTAGPLRELRILLHPALVDTGLGCSAIRLDQFADTVTDGNQALRELHDTEVTNVYRQHRAYVRAWAVRMLQLAAAPLTQGAYLRLGDDSLLHEHARQLANLSPKIGVLPDLPLDDFHFLSAKPEFYDDRLVNAVAQCAPESSIGRFDSCIRSTTDIDSYWTDTTASWAAPPPRIVKWSGVREQPWVLDEAVSFMASDQPLGPFRFIVQIAFASPPWFTSEGEWYADPTLELFDDETPYELTSVGDALMDEIASQASQNPETAEVLSRMAEFTYLQRVFRAVLDGHLVLSSMNLGNLATLARQTAGTVNRTQTLDWQTPPEEPAPATETPEEAQSEASASEIDALRTSLGLDEQLALQWKTAFVGCPPPEA